MGFMRRLLPLALLAAFATTASAEYTKYSDLRAENPVIDDVIGDLSSSNLHGTFNRISALFTRGQMRDLADGTLDADLPANVQRNLQSALTDLGEDLEAANDDLVAAGYTGDDLLHRQWVLVQVVNLVFNSRMVEISYIDNNISCGTSQPDVTCPYDAGVATATFDVFNDELLYDADDPSSPYSDRPLTIWLAAINDSADDEDPEYMPFANGGLDGRDLVSRVEQLQTTSPLIGANSLVHGVPSIDP